MRLRLFACLLLSLTFFDAAEAQQKQWGVGFRGSLDGLGIHVKHFLDPELALLSQVNAGGLWLYEGKSFVFSSFVIYHLPLPMPQIRLFFGGGGHIGSWNNRERTPVNAFIAGVDGMAGIEFISTKSPLAYSIDVKPSINFLDNTSYFGHNLIGVSLRYYFAPSGNKKS